MIATILDHNGSRCVCLVFDDGSHAVNFAEHRWMVYSPEGYVTGQFHDYKDSVKGQIERSIKGFSSNYVNKLGRIEI